MRCILILAILLGGSVLVGARGNTVSQSKIRSEVSKVSKSLNSLRESNGRLERMVSAQRRQIDSLSDQVTESQATIKKLAESTDVNLPLSVPENKDTQPRLREMDETIAKRTIYSVIIILSITLVGIISLVFVRRSLYSRIFKLDSKIAASEEGLETLRTNAYRGDRDLAELLKSHLAFSKKEILSGETPEIDHKLPLKVGDEIHRMRKRVDNMSQDVKGLGALRNSLNRLEEEFNDNGYEIEELLGKPFHPGMNVEARFVEDPNVPIGEEIVVEVLRPQIMFRSKLIQHAKVEVGKSF